MARSRKLVRLLCLVQPPASESQEVRVWRGVHQVGPSQNLAFSIQSLHQPREPCALPAVFLISVTTDFPSF